MNCANHAEARNEGFCIRCGRALCRECVRDVRGSVYCEDCLADLVQNKRPAGGGTQMVAGANPGAAFALGLIPGVGAIYNGEFLKAAIHVLIFGMLITLAEAARPAEGLFTLSALAFYIYMPFEAYYTAKKRKLKAEGVELETPVDRLHQEWGELKNKELWGGVLLVVTGSLFLLGNFGLFQFYWIGRLWPVILIVAGVWLLKRFQERTV